MISIQIHLLRRYAKIQNTTNLIVERNKTNKYACASNKFMRRKKTSFNFVVFYKQIHKMGRLAVCVVQYVHGSIYTLYVCVYLTFSRLKQNKKQT